MAIMIPGMETKEDFNASGGELLLYELLAQLPDEYYVFHSTRWKLGAGTKSCKNQNMQMHIGTYNGAKQISQYSIPHMDLLSLK